MNIIILADTHLPKKNRSLPPILLKELETADLIVHAGDWQTREVYEELSQFAPIKGVHGNVDDNEVKVLFPLKCSIEVGSLRIGVTHGHGKQKTTEKRAVDCFKDENMDLIIFGHSHIPVHKEYDGKVIFNPGSPTYKRRQPKYSFGKLQVSENGSFELNHVYFDDTSI